MADTAVWQPERMSATAIIGTVKAICKAIGSLSHKYPIPGDDIVSEATGLFEFWFGVFNTPSWDQIEQHITQMIKEQIEAEARANVLNIIMSAEDSLDIALKRVNAPVEQGGWRPDDPDAARQEAARAAHYESFSDALKQCKDRSHEIFRTNNTGSRRVSLPFVERFVLAYTVLSLGKFLLSETQTPAYELLELEYLNQQACDFYLAISPSEGELWLERVGGVDDTFDSTPNYSLIRRHKSGFTMWIMDDHDSGHPRNPSNGEWDGQWDPNRGDHHDHMKRMYHFLCHRAYARYFMYAGLIPVERLDVFYSQIHENGLLPPHASKLIETVKSILRSQTDSQLYWINEMAQGSLTRKMHAGCDVDDPSFFSASNKDDLHINPATRNWPFHLETINKGYV